ncbi:E3 ubiquitin-protein ligase ring1a-like protein, partial [Thalictrum thalictroides]
SNGSRSSKDEDNDEYVTVNLADIRKEVQCPICLGIIRKTRTVMECLHRFCRECIDKSMRMGNNECPACRTHCASRRSLRDDPNYDALIAAIYQDIDKYEAEELAFREEEKTRNKQIQASIAQTFQRQTEALGRKRTTAKAVAAYMRRSRGRRRGRSSRNSRAAELQVSDDDEDENGNEGGRDSSSADERVADVKSKRCKRWPGPRYSQPSAVDADGDCDGNNDTEVSRESTIAFPAFMGSPEILAWGRGGARSHTRYGSVGNNGKNGRNNRIARLVDHLRSSDDNVDMVDVYLVGAPLDGHVIPSLEEPFLRCRPTLSVGQLCQFVSLQTPLQAEDVEILLVKEPRFNPLASDGSHPSIDPGKDILQLVEEQKTLEELLAACNFNGSNLVLAYREKISK